MSAVSLPTFNVREIPFSRRGSWLDLSPVIALHTRVDDVHLVSHVNGMHAVLRLRPVRCGSAVASEITATPAMLEWSAGAGGMRAVFEADHVIRVAGTGVGLELADAATGLTPFTGSYLYQDPADRSYVFTSYETGRRYRITVLRGQLEATGSEALGTADRHLVVTGESGWELVIEETTAAREPYVPGLSFEAALESVTAEFTSYLSAIAGWDDGSNSAVALAAYALWSATVSPEGFMTREGILMSKHWMDKLWSWDHAFNALAVAPGLAEHALDQFLAPFDHQDEAGAMPDSITHSEVLYNYVKPPIHGWALRLLRERAPRPLRHDELSEIYVRLSRWSRFWLCRRTASGRRLPYYQHGNDSGWDNSTMFDHDRVVEAPDLAAFLLIQLDVLADLADELGRSSGPRWREMRDGIRRALLEQLHDEGGFFAVGSLSGTVSKRSSLLNLLPVLAADRLPADVGVKLAAGIERHLTEWGLATQLVDSEEYEDDGYWRGPIWAPSTMIIEDGLRRGGFTQLADIVSSRFRRLCEHGGFAENFDAVTGEGLRDRAYTWTASVYLILARDAVLRGA